MLLFPHLLPQVVGVVAPAWIPAEMKPEIHIGFVRYYIPAHPRMARDRKHLWDLLELNPCVAYSLKY